MKNVIENHFKIIQIEERIILCFETYKLVNNSIFISKELNSFSEIDYSKFDLWI